MDEVSRKVLITRTDNALVKAGITSVEQLTAMSAQQLLKIPNIGRACVRLIRQRLAARGLSLRNEPVSSVSQLLHTQHEPEVVARRLSSRESN